MNLITFAIGILAQCCFSARVIIQWFLSERSKKSVSPIIFWYLSLFGSILMFYYGAMRNDLPIIIGQIATYYVYIANLKYKKSRWILTVNSIKLFLLILPIISIWAVFLNGFPLRLCYQNIDIKLFLLGLIGQIIFVLRFMIQFLSSYKKRKSIFPISFWWLSILGSIFILSYGYLRSDWILMLGHSFGIFTYSRNLLLGKNK